MNAAITGIAAYVPENVVTNDDLAKIVDTNDEWITTRTGIKERRKVEPGVGASDIGAIAVTELLAKTNTHPDEVDMIICATVTPDSPMPDTANTIADKVGINNAFGYDINAACSGFLYALTTGAKYVESGSHKKVIVVGVDVMSSILNYEDRTTCIIFGDGGGAVMLEPSEEHGVIDSVFRSDGGGREYLNIKAGGSKHPTTMETLVAKEHFVYQNGRPVFKAAVKGMSETTTELLKRNNLTTEDIDWLTPHQANIRIIESVSNFLDYPMEKVMVNIHKYGNTTAGTLPLCLADYESQLKKGDKIILTAFGGGFTWGSTLLEWAY